MYRWLSSKTNVDGADVAIAGAPTTYNNSNWYQLPIFIFTFIKN